jgi:hypothetical protein
MCRNIKTLYNFEPPATDAEIRSVCLQFVRKISGSNTPSKANADAFERAIDGTAAIMHDLLESLSTTAPPRAASWRRRKRASGHRAARANRASNPHCVCCLNNVRQAYCPSSIAHRESL